MPPPLGGGGSPFDGVSVFITVQLPFVDMRGFSAGGAPVLKRPLWPLPSAGEFVRGVGHTHARPLGGVGSWIGEPTVCDASRALRYPRHPFYTVDEDSDDRIRHWGKPYVENPPAQRLFHVPFRRLYFDGLAVGKVEVGFTTETPLDGFNPLGSDEVLEVVAQALSTQVAIPAARSHEQVHVELSQAGPPFAEYYAWSSRPHGEGAAETVSQVRSGEPVVFVQLNFDPRPPKRRFTPLSFPPTDHSPAHTEDLALGRELLVDGGLPHRVWMLDSSIHNPVSERWGDISLNERDYQRKKDHVRALRIAVLRLHAEKQAFRVVQRAILSGELEVAPRSLQSDRLQLYLNRAVARIRGKESRVADLLEGHDIITWVRAFEDRLTPGEGAELLNSLELLELRLAEMDVRPQVRENVIRYEREVTIVMGDQNINLGQAGSIGRNSHGQVVNHALQWQQVQAEHSWPEVQDALRAVIPALQRAAQTDEHRQALKHVQKASNAADENDGPLLLHHLRRAGTWVGTVASNVGAELVAKLITGSLQGP